MLYRISRSDRLYIDQLRGLLILRVMLGHLGLLWFFPPYSSYLGAMLPVLFFVSGAASYNSFKNSSFKVYLRKRLLSILVPFYLLFLLISVFSVAFNTSWNPEYRSWILFSPNTNGLPFELGQSWFLQSLVIVVLLSFPFFLLATKNVRYLAIPMIASLVCMMLNTFFDLSVLKNVFGLNLLYAFTYLFFFMAGVTFFSISLKDREPLIRMVFCICIGLFLVSLTIIDRTNFSYYKGNPDIFFFISCTLCISGFLYFKKSMQRLFNFIPILNSLLLFSSKHAYAIFLLHTIVIGFSELFIFQEKLTGNYTLASVKMMFVSVITLLIAPIFTRLTNIVLKKLTSLFKRAE